MIGELFIRTTVEAVERALAGTSGQIAVVGPVRLAGALTKRGHSAIALVADPRSLRRKHLDGACAGAAALPVGDGAFGAIVGAGAGSSTEWLELLLEWTRVVVEGGAVVMVDRGARPELSRRALCGGLMDIEQRTAGRTVVTSGLVAKIPG